MARTSADPDERTIEMATLREKLVGLRLTGEESVRLMQQSLRRHGQLSALAAFRAEDDGLEIVDGFKRLRAARELGWRELRVRVMVGDAVAATAALAALNDH